MARLANILNARPAFVKKSELTPQQIRVCRLIAVGASLKEAATELNLSVKTIEKHTESAYRRLDVHSVIGMTRKLILKDLLTWDEFMQPHFIFSSRVHD